MRFLSLCILALLLTSGAARAADNPLMPSPEEIQQRRAERQQRQAEMKHIADINIAQSQARTARTLNDLVMLFPDAIKQPAGCYQAALTSYVEDQWNRITRDITCPAEHPDCGKDAAGDESMRKTLAAMHMPPAQIEQAMRPMVALNVADAVYKYMLPIDWSLSPDNKIDSFNPQYVRDKSLMKIDDVAADTLKIRRDELMKYVATCDTRKSADWSLPNAAYPDLSSTSMPPFKLGIYAILMQHLLGGQLPEDKKGYVGCLTRFNRLRTEYRACSDTTCIAAIPADDKATLLKQLDDLKAHQCDEAYTKKIAYRLESGSDVDPPPSKDDAKQKSVSDTAQLSIVRTRALNQHLLDELTLFFGDTLKYSKTCYQSALSNYIDDQWRRIADENKCSEDAFCANVESKNKTAATWDYLADVIRGQMGDMTVARRNVEQQNVFAIANAIYTYMRPVDYALEPNDRMDSFNGDAPPDKKSMGVPDVPEADVKKRVADLRQYFATCSTRKPAAWSVPGAPLDEHRLFEATLKLGIYNLLVKTAAAGEAPDGKAGYVGCLGTLAEARMHQTPCMDKTCSETLPARDKSQLTRQLEDLKAHKCSAAYALQLARQSTAKPAQ